MAISIFNREYSAECMPGGSAICDGGTDLCECPCHEEGGTYRVPQEHPGLATWESTERLFSDALTVGDMQRAHVLFWKDVPLSPKELTRRF